MPTRLALPDLINYFPPKIKGAKRFWEMVCLSCVSVESTTVSMAGYAQILFGE